MWEAKKWVFGSGMFTLFLGSATLIFQTAIFSYTIELFMRLSGKSYIFDVWQSIPMDIPTNITFFNWTNHEDFYTKDIKPKFEEIGPYRFLSTFDKVDLVQNDNDTITYKQLKTYRYDDNFENNGNLSDKIITINYISMFLAHNIKYWEVWLKDGFSQFMSIFDPNYYFETTAGAETIYGNDNTLIELMNYFDFISPEILRMDRFGWVRMRNSDPNYSGVFNVRNGVNRQFDLVKWNHETDSHYYKAPCNKIKGSTGEIQSTSGNKDYIDVFVPDACRSFRLYFEKEEIIDGIIGHKFVATNRTMDNGAIDPENECVCDGDCFPPGLINATSCSFGLNVLFSLPHYYVADESYVNAVEGINPNKSLHEAYIIIEPNTRICLDFRLRAQINVLTRPIEGLTDLENFQKLYFPLFWVEQAAGLPENFRGHIKTLLNFPYVIIACGIVLTLVGSCMTAHSVYKIIEPYRIKNSCINNRTFSVILESVPLNQNKSLC